MKKFLVLLLLIALAASLFGCGATDNGTDTGVLDVGTVTDAVTDTDTASSADPVASVTERHVEPITTLKDIPQSFDWPWYYPEDIICGVDTPFRGRQHFSVYLGTVKEIGFTVRDNEGRDYRDPDANLSDLCIFINYSIEVKESIFGPATGTVVLSTDGSYLGDREEEQLKLLNEANQVCTGTLNYYPNYLPYFSVGDTYLFTTIAYDKGYPYEISLCPQQTCFAPDSKEAKDLIAYFNSDEAKQLIAAQAEKKNSEKIPAQTE